MMTSKKAGPALEQERGWGRAGGIAGLFHHPDISWTVLRRGTGDALLEMLFAYAEFGASVKRMLSRTVAPTPESYYSAVGRLRRAGVVVTGTAGGRIVSLSVSPVSSGRIPDWHRPERFWKARWNRIWYVLIYDVPESQRRYRSGLRRWLRSMRLGCLQRSVWITHRDIRPEYNDMVKAAALDTCAVLFEARTVLGMGGAGAGAGGVELREVAREPGLVSGGG